MQNDTADVILSATITKYYLFKNLLWYQYYVYKND